MELNDKVTQLEDEIKILKNEVQAVLLDLRESFLKNENPFNYDKPAMTSRPAEPMPAPPADNTPPSPPDIQEEIPVPDEKPVKQDPEGTLPKDTPAVSVKETPLTGPDLPEPAPAKPQPAIEIEAPLDIEPDPESEPVTFSPSGATAEPKTALKEVKRERRTNRDSAASFRSVKNTAGFSGEKLDLETIGNLARWVDRTVQRLGHERTEAVLGISETMGYVNTDLKDILIKFIKPSPENQAKASTQDYLASLIELDGLVGNDNKMEIALLYMLCQENDNR